MKFDVAWFRNKLPTLQQGSGSLRSNSTTSEGGTREAKEHEPQRRRGRSTEGKCRDLMKSQAEGTGRHQFIGTSEVEFRDLYEFAPGAQGREIKVGRKRLDGTPVVIKSCPKSATFRNVAAGKAWCSSTERMLKLPESAGICKVMEVYSTQQNHHVVMERCQGHDFYKDLKAVGVRPEREIKYIVCQLLGGLKVLHENGLLHRDLKLGNVILNPKNLATKIIDFDTVSAIEDLAPIEKVILGTDGFIAPEVYEGRPSTASDMYALGVIIYRMMTKKYPHSLSLFDDQPGENYVGYPAIDRIRKRLHTTAIDFDVPGLDGHPGAVSFLRALLDFDPSRRPSPEQALAHRWFTTEDRVLPMKFKDELPSMDLKGPSPSSALKMDGPWSRQSTESTCEGLSNTSLSLNSSTSSRFSIAAMKCTTGYLPPVHHQRQTTA